MKMTLRIKEAAKERAVSLSSIAGKLGIHRSNMSAIASGSRGISLKTLDKIARILNCSMDELVARKEPQIFRNRALGLLIRDIENTNYDGMDKAWVDAVMLAGSSHYRAVRKSQ